MSEVEVFLTPSNSLLKIEAFPSWYDDIADGPTSGGSTRPDNYSNKPLRRGLPEERHPSDFKRRRHSCEPSPAFLVEHDFWKINTAPSWDDFANIPTSGPRIENSSKPLQRLLLEEGDPSDWLLRSREHTSTMLPELPAPGAVLVEDLWKLEASPSWYGVASDGGPTTTTGPITPEQCMSF
jgi:hypothetical protein